MDKETRAITQAKVYALVMNPMTDRAESQRIGAVSYDKQKLIDFHNSELADEIWEDGRFRKSFKKGSPLEWLNPIYSTEFEQRGTFGHGIMEDWVIDDGMVEKGDYHFVY